VWHRGKPQEGQGDQRYAVSMQSLGSPEISWNDGSLELGFVSKLGERGMPFYRLLHKHDGFQWDE